MTNLVQMQSWLGAKEGSIEQQEQDFTSNGLNKAEMIWSIVCISFQTIF